MSSLSYVLTSFGISEEIIAPFADYLAFALVLALTLFCVVLAFHGYRIFVAALTLNGAFLIGIIGYILFGPLVNGLINNPRFDFGVVVGLVFAAIGAIFVHYCFAYFKLILGGAVGYLLGDFLILQLLRSMNSYFFDKTPTLWVLAISALIFGALYLFFYKYIYVVTTAFGGMLTAFYFMGILMMPIYGTNYLSVLVVLGVIGGFFATLYQFLVSGKETLDTLV